MKRSFQLWLVAVLLCMGPLAFAQLSIPEIAYDSVPNLLKLPDDIYLGEAVGVATNSKGNIFVYTRTGSPGITVGTERVFARGNGAARLFEFDPSGKFVREIGQGLYGFVFAHAVRVDPQDNIWVVDEGSNMVIKFGPDGRVLMTMGRKPEAVIVPGAPPPSEGGGREAAASRARRARGRVARVDRAPVVRVARPAVAEALQVLEVPALAATTSIARPTWRGTRRETFSCPTATEIPESRNSTRVGNFSPPGALAG